MTSAGGVGLARASCRSARRSSRETSAKSSTIMSARTGAADAACAAMDESAVAVAKVINIYFFMGGLHGRGTMRLR